MHKRALIFINGEVADLDFVSTLTQPDDQFIAVDGGLRHVLALNRQPHLLIGDLDSITPAQLQALSNTTVEILKFPEDKNETDLELALLEAARREFTEIVLIGALGGRVDQMLANLYLLLLPELSHRTVRVVESHQEIFIIRGHVRFDGREGDVVSLLPLKGNAAGVSTTGLKYPLENETLMIEHSRGISNRMLGRQASITLTGGCLLCIHSWAERKEPK